MDHHTVSTEEKAEAPVDQLLIEELLECKDYFLAGKKAYNFAYDNGPSDSTRIIACRNSWWALRYALDIDKCARDDTRAGACGDPGDACSYAFHVDKSPSNTTRESACKHPLQSYCYARDIDKGPRNDTRNGACKDTEWAFYYARDIDKCFNEATYTSIHKNPREIKIYFSHINL